MSVKNKEAGKMKLSSIDVGQEIWTYEDYRELPNDRKIYQVIKTFFIFIDLVSKTALAEHLGTKEGGLIFL